MQVLHPVCCGIAVHSAPLTACLRRVRDDGQITTELVDGGTTSRALIAFRTWLQEQQCPVVAMESTGVYGKPVSHVLRQTGEVCVANSHDVRQRPGKKTDERDATWMAALLAHGLSQPRFVPPPEIRALRDLTRTRVSLVQTRTQAKHRGYKILEDTNVKVASVVSDVFGKSARRMLEALVAGARDAAKLSAMALGSLRRKMPQFAVALEGQFTAHHATRIAGALELGDMLGRQLGEIEQQLHALLGPMAPQLEQLDRIPGINEITGRAISRDWPGYDAFWLGGTAGGVGRRIAREQRKCGETTSGAHTPGQSVSAARVGAVCLGDPQARDIFGTDVSPAGGTRGGQESRGGSGA